MPIMVVIFSFIFLSLFSFSSALPDDSGNRIDFTYEIPINYSLIPTVNNTQYLQGYTPTTLNTLYVPYIDSLYDVDLGAHDFTATDLNATGYGFFSWLGNLANKITSIFATTIHTETLNSTGTIYSNQTCYTQDCSAKIYHNGTGIIITS